MVRGIVELCKAFAKQREGTNCTEQVEVTSESLSGKGERLDMQRGTGTIPVWKHQRKEGKVMTYTEKDRLGAGPRGIPEAKRGELVSDHSADISVRSREVVPVRCGLHHSATPNQRRGGTSAALEYR